MALLAWNGQDANCQIVRPPSDGHGSAELPAAPQNTVGPAISAVFLESTESGEGSSLASATSYSEAESVLEDKPYGATLGSGYPTVRVTGFFQADAGWFDQNEANRNALVDGLPLGDIPDGADFRRTRLAATGDVADNVGYMIEMDFAFPGRPSFMDVYMEVRDLPLLGKLRIGQWRQPTSMDAMTSVRELVFLERGLPFAFVPFRQIGIGFSNVSPGERLTWALSAFRYPTDVYGGNVGDQGGYGLAGRVTALALEPSDDVLLHLGASYSYANPSYDRLRYRNQPEFFVSEMPGALVPPGPGSNVPPFVDTGVLTDAQSYSLAGLEAAALWGRLYVQSEAMFLNVERKAAGRLSFPAAYAQMAYVLTGETRPYKHGSGVFGRIVPSRPFRRCGGWGAWEIAARWSHLDLNDGNVAGNRLNNVTLGLNWYLNKNAKLQFNYIHAMLDSQPAVESYADIYAFRAQLDF